ncbi:MAG: hypothetical protein ACETWM_21460 [Candidatus Lokiarchaeia archaeon]
MVMPFWVDCCSVIVWVSVQAGVGLLCWVRATVAVVRLSVRTSRIKTSPVLIFKIFSSLLKILLDS